MRDHLLNLLSGKGAHLTFDEAIADFPPAFINVRPPNLPYSLWHLVEHMRVAQWDILEFVRNPNHVSPDWPDGYWPDRSASADKETWHHSIEQFQADLEAVKDLVRDPDADFLAELPHAPGYTLLREILLVADHNAYHTGELAILRQAMAIWPESREP
jgi:hypothetical protein